MALCFAEKIAFDTTLLGTLLASRLSGSFDSSFGGLGQDQPFPIQWSQIAPLKFLGTPGLWVGLLFAAAFLAAAVRLRRYRGQL